MSLSSLPPLISVVMPVYRSDDFLQESIESIINQTYRNFEFIIICDDPSERTREIIDKYRKEDNRIIVIYQKKEGIIASLNKGCSIAKGKYILRMDADDISLNNRLEIQVGYMENNPGVGLCGSWIETFGESNQIFKYYCDDSSIKANLIFSPSFAHPSVIIRKSVMDQNNFHYSEGYPHAEDYELWTKFSRVTHFSNIPQVLLKYRIHPTNIGVQFEEEQIKTAQIISLSLLNDLNIIPTKNEIELHYGILNNKYLNGDKHVLNIHQWLLMIDNANRKEKRFPIEELSNILAKKWYECCKMNVNNGLFIWKKFWKSPLSKKVNLNMKEKSKFFIACILKGVTLKKIFT